jgi:hypothetical protein
VARILARSSERIHSIAIIFAARNSESDEIFSRDRSSRLRGFLRYLPLFSPTVYETAHKCAWSHSETRCARNQSHATPAMARRASTSIAASDNESESWQQKAPSSATGRFGSRNFYIVSLI